MSAAICDIGAYQTTVNIGAWRGIASAAKCATPVFDPTSGEYAYGTLIEITCSTSGSTIYYTIDGSDPDETDTEYTSEIELTVGVTIKAIAVAVGYDDSNIATEVYTISTTPISAQPLVFICT